MKQTLLVTLGCSWTFGVGVGYIESMKKEDFKKIAWSAELNNKFSFRGILAEKLNFTNLNFSSGGSSNQRQFRLAKEFFFSTDFKNLYKEYDEIVVLWGITSTARNELYDIELKNYNNFFLQDSYYEEEYNNLKGTDWPSYTDYIIKRFKNIKKEIFQEIHTTFEKKIDSDNWISNIVRYLTLFSYDLNVTIHELILEIRMFNLFFKHHDIKCIWFDTFNHHDYQSNAKSIDPLIQNTDTHLDNFLFFDSIPRDLLSLMLLKIGQTVNDFKYHYSEMKIDNDKIAVGTSEGLLNPITYHPTVVGHQLIANILEPEILKKIGRK